MTNEPKQCPFCGGEATLLVDAKYGYWTFHHDGKPKCPASYSHYADYTSEAEAIAAWNTRVERTCQNMWGIGFLCSRCGTAVSGLNTINYCPNCGAKVVE